MTLRIPAPPGTSYELRVLASPEPAGAALGGAAVLAVLARRGRRRSAGVEARCPPPGG